MQPVCGSRTRKTGHSGAKEETRPVKRREDKGRRQGKNTCKTPKKKDGKRKVNSNREKRKGKREGRVWTWGRERRMNEKKEEKG